MTSTNASTPKFDNDARGCLITVMTPKEPLPAAFKLKAANAAHRAIVRVTGGCKGFTKEAQEGMIPFFVDSFAVRDAAGNITQEFKGVAFSGGTINRDKDEALVTDMVTTVPAVLAHHYACVALSSTPRTDDIYAARHRSGLSIGNQDIDLGQHAAAIVQVSAAQAASAWDLDLPVYFDFMEDLQGQGFKTAIIAMNGGDITRDEIYGAIKRGFPVIAIEGSLRETDAFIKAARDGDWSATAAEFKAKQLAKGLPAEDVDAKVKAIVDGCKAILANVDPEKISIVPLNDAAAMRAALVKHGMLTA